MAKSSRLSLAGYIYNIAQIPQYEGTFTIQENEITDQVPLGYNLNLTGALAEWATMAACVQHISYDLSSGRTQLSLDPPRTSGRKILWSGSESIAARAGSTSMATT